MWCPLTFKSMEELAPNVCLPLPVTITRQVTTYEQREQYLINYLHNVLPSCDIKGISEEFRKSFTFIKHKTKIKKKKPHKSPFMTIRKGLLLGLNKFRKKSLHYTDMLPLNSLWLGYMHHMLNIEDFSSLSTDATSSYWENISQRIMKADYHGAKITVTRSKCPTIVGIKGIVVQDTKNTFRLLDEDDVIRTVSKESCVFQIHLENDVNIEVFGKELCIRPAERSVKKFKNLHIPEL